MNYALRADPQVITQTTRGIRANRCVSFMIDNIGDVDATLVFNGKPVTMAAGSQPIIFEESEKGYVRDDIFDIELTAPLGSSPEVVVWRDYKVEIPTI